MIFFYVKNRVPIFWIPERELSESALHVLSRLGCEFLAVTSPLKEQAFALNIKKDSLVKKLKSANTLIFQKGFWESFNTDFLGFKFFKRIFRKASGGLGRRRSFECHQRVFKFSAFLFLPDREVKRGYGISF